jgi:hypothetical protein
MKSGLAFLGSRMMNPHIVAVVFVGTMLARASAATPEDLSGAAYSTCQMFALDRLASPETARFPALGERGTVSRTLVRQKPGYFRVESFVDFRSERGERVRTRVYCDLRMLGPNRWLLEKLIMGNGERPALEREEAERRAAAAASHRRDKLTEWVATEFESEEARSPAPR